MSWGPDRGIVLAGGFAVSMESVSEFSSTVSFWVKKPKVLAFPTKTPCHLVSLGLGREKAYSVPSSREAQGVTLLLGVFKLVPRSFQGYSVNGSLQPQSPDCFFQSF